jgi:hypothetical protein
MRCGRGASRSRARRQARDASRVSTAETTNRTGRLPSWVGVVRSVGVTGEKRAFSRFRVSAPHASRMHVHEIQYDSKRASLYLRRLRKYARYRVGEFH